MLRSTKSPEIKRNHILLLAIALLLWSLIAWVAAKALIVKEPVDHADAIAVLSGAAAIIERAQLAAELYRQGRARKIILTNDNQRASWSSAQQRNPFFHELAIGELRRSGVPREDIELLPQPVSSTYDEAVLLRQYAEDHRLKAIVVVTSAYHSRRALWTLRHVFANTGIGIGLEPVPAGSQTPSSATWWLHLRGWKMVPGEYLKMIYYRLRFHQ